MYKQLEDSLHRKGSNSQLYSAYDGDFKYNEYT